MKWFAAKLRAVHASVEVVESATDVEQTIEDGAHGPAACTWFI